MQTLTVDGGTFSSSRAFRCRRLQPLLPERQLERRVRCSLSPVTRLSLTLARFSLAASRTSCSSSSTGIASPGARSRRRFRASRAHSRISRSLHVHAGGVEHLGEKRGPRGRVVFGFGHARSAGRGSIVGSVKVLYCHVTGVFSSNSVNPLLRESRCPSRGKRLAAAGTAGDALDLRMACSTSGAQSTRRLRYRETERVTLWMQSRQ